jgi:RNA polymerase sigma-70 factor (ECF subfamily)
VIYLFKRPGHRGKIIEYEKIIFEMHYERVYQAAYFILKDQYLAQDVTQETFLKAFGKIDTLDDGNKLGAWLGTIATRTAIDCLRKIKRRNDIPIEDVYIDEGRLNDPISSIEDKIEYKFLEKVIKKNISILEPPEYREVIILKYEYELNDKEIAAALGISVSATKSRLHRARKKLKTLLGDQLEERSDDIL